MLLPESFRDKIIAIVLYQEESKQRELVTSACLLYEEGDPLNQKIKDIITTITWKLFWAVMICVSYCVGK
jgi:hypothetical protein